MYWMRTLAAWALCVTLFAWAATRRETSPAQAQPDALRWWKGNLHTHTLWSDGDQYPDMVVDWYKSKGYHFLALTDHDVLQEGVKWKAVDLAKSNFKKYAERFGEKAIEKREVKGKTEVRLKTLAEMRPIFDEPGKFLLVAGEELTRKYQKFPVHINAINLRDRIQGVDGDSVQESVRANLRLIQEQERKAERPVLGFLNHPNYGNAVRAEDFASLEEMKFFEVHNGHPGVKNYGDAVYPGTERLWDIALSLRLAKLGLPLVYGLGTDDAHAYHTMGPKLSNPGRAWVMVRGKELSGSGVVRAMLAGDFYASTGVTLSDVAFDGKELKVTIAAETGVEYVTEFVATRRGTSLESEPVKDKDGTLKHVTRIYSPEVGKVVATVKGATASYALTGEELYVRARVRSTKAHPNPFQPGDREAAWTQPVTPRKS